MQNARQRRDGKQAKRSLFMTLGCKARGRDGDPPFDPATGKGRVIEVRGHYRDALLVKRNRTVVWLVESFGGIAPEPHGRLRRPSGGAAAQRARRRPTRRRLPLLLASAALTLARCCARTTFSRRRRRTATSLSQMSAPTPPSSSASRVPHMR